MPHHPAPKKTAKKAAKKAPKKHSPEHEADRFFGDFRRSYEHLGRVEALTAGLGSERTSEIHMLVALAQGALRAKLVKDAADLLRGAEHLAFGLLFDMSDADTTISGEMLVSVRDEYNRLLQRAEDHAAHHQPGDAVLAVYESMRNSAAKAMKSAKYRCALELARGAEALSHVSAQSAVLSAGPSHSRLRG